MSNCKRNPKTFWKYVRSKLCTKSGISPLLFKNDDPNSLKFDDKEKAEIPQEQFCSIFTKEHDRELPSMEKKTEKTITNLLINEDEVRREILQLNINKSCGLDHISPCMLIKLVDYVAAPLAKIMRKSMDSGELPHDWKNAFVSLIYKKSARNLPKNY